MSKLANAASAIRALIRALILCATAFGFKLTVDQVAAVQLVAEALIQIGTQWMSPGNLDPKKP